MTFTFTLDAFPDYTKFDQTHKVLAAILVITDEVNEEDHGSRPPCLSLEDMNTYEAKIEALESPGVTAYICSDNGNNIVVTGTSTGDKYDKAVFSGVTSDATELVLKLPTSKNGGSYTVTENNPVLSLITDESSATKTTNYTTTAGNQLEYHFLVSELSGPINITLQKQDSTNRSRATYSDTIVDLDRAVEGETGGTGTSTGPITYVIATAVTFPA